MVRYRYKKPLECVLGAYFTLREDYMSKFKVLVRRISEGGASTEYLVDIEAANSIDAMRSLSAGSTQAIAVYQLVADEKHCMDMLNYREHIDSINAL